MVLHKSLLILLTLILVSTTSVVAGDLTSELGWEPIVPGIDFQEYQLPDPNNVFVVRMDRTNLTATLDSTIGQGSLAGGYETVSSMYARYDQALNYWGGGSDSPNWGMRNQVIVAINGSYFDKNLAMPQGGMVYSGWYAKRFDDKSTGPGPSFAWKLDRSAFIGPCFDHDPDKQLIYYPAMYSSQPITQVNIPRGPNQLTLFTPQYASRTGTDNTGVEVVVEMSRPTMILPSPAYASGVVRKVFVNQGNNLIPFNSVVLSATGTPAQVLLENAQVGSEVRISQEIASYEYDCVTPSPLSWTKTYASIQGAYFYLRNWQIFDYDYDRGATERNPRTAVAYNDQFIYFIVVDGRDRYHSVGMTVNELAVFTRDYLSAPWAVTEDGGGSSTMVIDGVVVNNTYCNIYSCSWKYQTFLPQVSHSGDKNKAILPGLTIIRSPAGIERVVANGMVMLIAQPAEYSGTFTPGESVSTMTNAELRLGPGTNYASFTTLPAGSQGSIESQVNSLYGVLAKGSYWWYVNFSGTKGWIAETNLITP